MLSTGPSHHCRRLTIFEGCDGSGKSTAAKRYAEAIGARYVHFGPFQGVSTGFSRMLVEAMLPALLGHQDVVFDRCWYSEKIYGDVHRGGRQRTSPEQARMLERLARRCATMVVLCQPPWERVLASFRARKGQELLESEDALRQVYKAYERLPLSLPIWPHDYTTHSFSTIDGALLDQHRTTPHVVEVRSAGNLGAEIMLVGENFGNHKNDDPFYQWPFGSFSKLGCSHWLAEQLEGASIPESQLLWINADELAKAPGLGSSRLTIALGAEAAAALKTLGYKFITMPHPQSWKRFHHGTTYPLIPLLQEHLNSFKFEVGG